MKKTLFLCLFYTLSLSAFELHDECIIITPEKTGTNLLTRAIALLTKDGIHFYKKIRTSKEEFVQELDYAKKNGKIMHMHAFPEPHIVNTLLERGTKILFMMRDPRDQAISLLYYGMKTGYFFGPINPQGPFGKLSMVDKIDEIISGKRYGLSATVNMVGKRLPFMELPREVCLTTYFEKLVGPKGGGSKEEQLLSLKAIADHIHFKASKTRFSYVIKHVYGKEGYATFRSGQIGDWKNHFTEEHKLAFKKVFGHELIALGYETDFNW